MEKAQRTAFFISDGTGITAQVLGQSLLAQFNNVDFRKHTLPYIDTLDKAEEAVGKITQASEEDGAQAIVFDTIVDQTIRSKISASGGFMIDIFSTFLAPLESTLGTQSSYTVGRSHAGIDNAAYKDRINAMHFALENDDGASTKHFEDADLILIGVSRSGKTPSCLYLALQFGIYAANYPLTPEDMESGGIPAPLRKYHHKLFGLTIDAERLSAIRHERRANSRYADIRTCEDEVRTVESWYRRGKIPFIDTTHASVEEISTKILMQTGIERYPV